MISPLSLLIKFIMIFPNVDFPHPDSPTIPNVSPLRILNDTLFKAFFSLNFLKL